VHGATLSSPPLHAQGRRRTWRGWPRRGGGHPTAYPHAGADRVGARVV